jgi:hypothetical protein
MDQGFKGARVSGPGSEVPGSGFRGTRNTKHETRNAKHETRNQPSLTSGQLRLAKHGTRNTILIEFYCYAVKPLRPLTTVAFFDSQSFSGGCGEGGLRRYVVLPMKRS